MADIQTEVLTHSGQTIRVVQGDLTSEKVDAIVNAANSRLAHGGGVAGAIVARGGQRIQQESDRWVEEQGSVPTGSAAITGAGSLPARFVIHTVGPVWGSGNEEAKLASAVQSAMALADAHQLRSVSLPGISSGIFGFPKPLAAQVIVGAARTYLCDRPASALKEIRFCNIDQRTSRLFAHEVNRQFREAPGPSGE